MNSNQNFVDPARHCELCDNRVFDLLTGTTCGLTQQKPTFNQKCPDIKFENRHIDHIKEVNIEYYKVTSTRNLTIANFIVFSVISLAVMAGGYLLGAYAWDKGVISTVPLIIMGVGFLILPMATGPVVKYMQHIQVEKKKKLAMDRLLADYNIEYDIEVLVDEDLHGNKSYDAKINFTRFYYR